MTDAADPIPTRHDRARAPLAAALGVALVLAACSSTGDDTADAGTATDTTAAVASTAPDTTAGADTTPSTAPGTTAAPPGTSTTEAEAEPVADPPLTPVPDGYEEPAAARGSLTAFEYTTTHTADGSASQDKTAMVYLPPGYDQDDAATRHDIFYLMHGGGGHEATWLGRPSSPTSLVSIFDHMITDGVIPPMIVVAPTFDTGPGSFDASVDAFASELVEDLVPAIEGTYRTHADGTDAEALIDARDHRIFGGFSMGGVTTWHMLETRTPYFRHYLPMSGESWALGRFGGSSSPVETAGELAEAVTSAGYEPSDYLIFSATGTLDMAYENMSPQIAAMRERTDAFEYTETGFSDGNFMYYVVDGNRHNYPWGYEYIYNGLRLFAAARS
ncbi:MAG: alpha/beta hydrolase-fold protein [Actinomycetota bacterium]|nr:alpha/beta hydrolase-fold protein [Actinomycetota bacterium]